MPAGEHPISRACECGGALKLTHGVGKDHDLLDKAVEAFWLECHDGRGHGPCGIGEANRIRNNWLNRVNRKARRDAARVSP